MAEPNNVPPDHPEPEEPKPEEPKPVEIHPPDRPAHSWSDFFIHIATITTGILIALSLEGIREWRHHRSLVEEAHQNLRNEISENKRAMESSLKAFDEERNAYGAAVKFANERIQRGKTQIREIQLGFRRPTLTTAAWETAQATGALGHMKYSDVKAYAEVYHVQRMYSELFGRKLDQLSQAIGTVVIGDPNEASREELKVFRDRLAVLLGGLQMEQEMAKSLLHAYDDLLKTK